VMLVSWAKKNYLDFKVKQMGKPCKPNL
jgi:hypothetical protein